MGRTTFSGPVAGGYLAYAVPIPDATASSAAAIFYLDNVIPDDAKWSYFGASVSSTTRSGSMTVEIGSSADANGYNTAITVPNANSTYAAADGALVTSTNPTSVELFNDTVGTPDTLRVAVTRSAATHTNVVVTLHFYVTGHPSSI